MKSGRGRQSIQAEGPVCVKALRNCGFHQTSLARPGALSQTFPFPLIVAFLNISNYTKLHTFPFHHYMVE